MCFVSTDYMVQKKLLVTGPVDGRAPEMMALLPQGEAEVSMTHPLEGADLFEFSIPLSQNSLVFLFSLFS